MMKFEDIIKLKQTSLFNTICHIYKKNVVKKVTDRYILVKGTAPVLCIAHLDTVHKQKVKHIMYTKDGDMMMSPQGIGGDDRCGVYALMFMYETMKTKPWLLFTCDEEIGGIGAKYFATEYAKGLINLQQMKFLIEFDRKGSNDAVYYDCENPDFEDYITGKGFKTSLGSYSDISTIAPTLKVAAVNLSSGYYNAHTQHEYIVVSELQRNIARAMDMIRESVDDNFPVYEYIEAPRYSYFGDDYTYQSPVDEAELDSIPVMYRWMYENLRYDYSKKEIDGYRAEYGDKVIEELYRDTYGDYDYAYGHEDMYTK